MSVSSEVPLAKIPVPTHRRLKVYALDPSLSIRSATRNVAEALISVPWDDIVDQGPVGEYVEVIDYDASSGCFYLPVDLNNPFLLATDGLTPSTSDPRFHQQMVYAVAMKTICHFEEALGRRILWRDTKDHAFVPRLRIYPHAFRKINAFYDPERIALLFGYFRARPTQAKTTVTDGLVFSCLSFDIVCHETTHAILDGMMRRFIENTNPDVLAFHEAFADLIALFQHFTLTDLLHHQITTARGSFEADNLLVQLAGEFAEGSGREGALRDAVGEVVNGQWTRATPQTRRLANTLEPHSRGAILVSAVFDAFITIYTTRIADLLRIATNGTGMIQPGALPHDLVARLAEEASKVAGHMLKMMIRALDYCPPVDLTFGEFLRAVVTADYDLNPNDRHGYRVALVEAFRKWDIYPSNVPSLGEESLRWLDAAAMLSSDDLSVLGQLQDKIRPVLRGFLAAHDGLGGDDGPAENDRERVFDLSADLRRDLHRAIREVHQGDRDEGTQKALSNALGLLKAIEGGVNGEAIALKFEVHEARLSVRIRPNDRVQVQRDLIVQITQRFFADRATLKPVSASESRDGSDDILFRGGCTLVIDPHTGRIRYAIRKRIDSDDRLARQRDFEGGRPVGVAVERTFEMLHGGEEF